MISVIIPIYNSEKWLPATLSSLYSQSFKDWELIAVDDGSSDRSGNILLDFKELCEKNDTDAIRRKVRIFTTPNLGVAAARNLALSKAEGQFVAFLDSDDILPEYALDYLLDLCLANNADIATGPTISFNDNPPSLEKALRKCGKALKKSEAKKVRIISGTEAVEESLYQRTNLNSSLWAKVFRRSILKDMEMIPGEIYEDLDYFYRVAFNAGSVVIGELPVYLYRQRDGSIIHSFSPRRLDVLKVTERMTSLIAKAAPALLPAAIDRRFSANFNMLRLISKHECDRSFNEEDRDLFQVKKEEIHNYLKSHSLEEIKNHKSRLKNRLGALLYLLLPSSLLTLLLKKL